MANSAATLVRGIIISLCVENGSRSYVCPSLSLEQYKTGKFSPGQFRTFASVCQYGMYPNASVDPGSNPVRHPYIELYHE